MQFDIKKDSLLDKESKLAQKVVERYRNAKQRLKSFLNPDAKMNMHNFFTAPKNARDHQYPFL